MLKGKSKRKELAPHKSRTIRTGDKVIVISGNNKGQRGPVRSIEDNRVIIEGVNLRKKHVKKRQDQPGAIITRECSIHISNVRCCAADDQPVKLRVRYDSDSNRELYYNNGSEDVTYRSLKSSN